MGTDIEGFYDGFAPRLLRDYLQGNRRVERQLRFFAEAIPRITEAILIIGCGSGESSNQVARRIAPKARILSVDISTENLRVAQALFSHDRVQYRKVDVVAEQLEGHWEAILLPDVYEHIELAQRPVFHAKLASILTKEGRLILTVPSPYHQAALAAAGEGLQLVDEVVTVEDLLKLATDVDGTLTYFSFISVWHTNDYIHAMIERQAARYATLTGAEQLPIKGWRNRTIVQRAGTFAAHRLRLHWWRRLLRRSRVRRLLAQVQVNSASPRSEN